jgi:GxxExxY protein
MITDKNIKTEYPESALTSKIINCAFKVFNVLGYGLPEKVYQTAMAREMETLKIHFKRECYGNIKYYDQIVGKYFLDFLVENKVAVELKVRNNQYKSDEKQLLSYLTAKNIKIGLLLIITDSGVKIKRMIK